MFSVRYELNFSAFIIQTVNWEACSRGVEPTVGIYQVCSRYLPMTHDRVSLLCRQSRNTEPDTVPDMAAKQAFSNSNAVRDLPGWNPHQYTDGGFRRFTQFFQANSVLVP